MERKFFEFLLNKSECIPGGSKEACIKVREFIRSATIDQDGNIISSERSSVDSKEFMEAVRVLMAFAWQNREQDCVPDRFVCNEDCSSLDYQGVCLGECQLISKETIEKNSSEKVKAKRCPYFIDSLDV